MSAPTQDFARCVPAVLAATTDAGLSHPATRAVHAVNNARQIAAVIVGIDGRNLGELLAYVPADIAALQTMLECQAEQLADLREEGCRMAQYIVRLENADTTKTQSIVDLTTRLAVASRDVEQLLQRASIRLQGEATDFNAIRGLRDVLDSSVRVEDHGGYVILDTRQQAAGVAS